VFAKLSLFSCLMLGAAGADCDWGEESSDLICIDSGENTGICPKADWEAGGTLVVKGSGRDIFTSGARFEIAMFASRVLSILEDGAEG